MEQYNIVHDRTNATEHPLNGANNTNIYSAKVESTEVYPTPPEKIPDIIAYLSGRKEPDYVFNEAASNYGDITVY